MSGDFASHRPGGIAAIRRPLLHLLAGGTLSSLTRTLWRHGGASVRSYPQVAVMFASALARWPGCVAERLRLARRLEAASFDPPPVFIVGHWRSGTTFLHNLLSRDPRFCFPTIVDALRPYDFYPNPFEFISRRVLLRYLPPIRPMDDVRLDAEAPQEEELALAAMGAPSFFNCFFFPRRLSEVFAKEVLFADGDEETLRSWRDALRYYLAKLAALHPHQRLLLKNPAHSARIPHLRRLFPGAKFIHIHRHPLAVFQSTRKLYHSMLPLLALQDYRPADVDSHVLWAYPEVITRLLDALGDLPAGHLTVVRYDELAADPATTLERIYGELDLGDFDQVKPIAAAYCDAHPHVVSPTPNIDPETASRLAFHWGAAGARLGYRSLESASEAAMA
jgi:hypothetical protein